MLVVPPPPAAVGAYGIATAGMTPSVLGPAGLLILIGTTLTNSACENTSRPGARGKDLACYTMAFCATTATIAAMATPDMPQTFNDREGAHYGAQPHKYKMEEPLLRCSVRAHFRPGRPTACRCRAPNAI